MSTTYSALHASSAPGSSPLVTSFISWMTRSSSAKQITKLQKLEVRPSLVTCLYFCTALVFTCLYMLGEFGEKGRSEGWGGGAV